MSVDPPERVAKIILARANAKMFPQIAGVITTPTLLDDGSILEQEGYDAATRLFLTLDREFKMPPIASKPTRHDAAAALKLLRDLIAEFPFAGEDRECKVNQAAALSAIMTAVHRGTLPTAPMHVFRAHAAGSGKSLLVDIAAAIATGRLCPVIGAGKNEEETEKRLGALLREGAPIISLDNVNGVLGGDALAQLTERPLVRVRLLGHSETPTFECRSAVYATGNNLVVAGDMTRRVVFCTLDVKVERPELREFKFDPIERVLADRGAYVGACLTIARAYLAADAPRPRDMSPIGSYSQWSRRVREPLVWLGELDPLESMEKAREEDPELGKLRNVMTAWRDTIGIGRRYEMRLRDVIELSKDGIHLGRLARPELHEGLTAVALRGNELSTDALSKWLRGCQGRVVGSLRFATKRDDIRGARWWIEQLDPAKPCEISETPHRSRPHSERRCSFLGRRCRSERTERSEYDSLA